MPLGFRREGPPYGRVAMLDERFKIGRDGGSDLVVHDLRVSRSHARVRYVKGEVLLSAEEGAHIWVNGQYVPFLALTPGDRVDLLPPALEPGVRLVFENRLHNVFVPPGSSFVAAWLAQPGFQAGQHGPERYGVSAKAATEAVVRGVDPSSEQPVAVRVGPAIARADDAERALRAVNRWAGGYHPALTHVLDAGLLPSPEGPRLWTALTWVEGLTAADLLSQTPLPPAGVLRLLIPVAYGLAWLHRRGLVHRDVAPGNVVAHVDGRGVLIDLDRVQLLGVGGAAGRGVTGTPGYVAPEEVLEGGPAAAPADVYGLCALAYALLTGRAPAEGDNVLETVARAVRTPPRPSALGVSVPDELSALLLDGLAADPAERPSAADVGRRMEAVRADLAAGDR